jgi:uncharacterized protein YggT (Ycf19 family)
VGQTRAPDVIQLLNIVYTLASFVMLLLIGQLLVRVLSFGRHEENAVYRFLRFLVSPVTKVVRRITPSRVDDRHVPVVTFFLLFWVCFALAVYLPTMVGASR